MVMLPLCHRPSLRRKSNCRRPTNGISLEHFEFSIILYNCPIRSSEGPSGKHPRSPWVALVEQTSCSFARANDLLPPKCGVPHAVTAKARNGRFLRPLLQGRTLRCRRAGTAVAQVSSSPPTLREGKSTRPCRPPQRRAPRPLAPKSSSPRLGGG